MAVTVNEELAKAYVLWFVSVSFLHLECKFVLRIFDYFKSDSLECWAISMFRIKVGRLIRFVPINVLDSSVLIV